MPGKSKLQLRDVTVCAADSVHPLLAARALELCVERCRFGDAILFSDTPVTGNFRHVPIPRLESIHAYSRFCLRDMPLMTDTPYVLVVQWDGYVVDQSAWNGAFRKCDYVGALIHPAKGPAFVGNGGFSLRSRKLLKALATIPVLPGAPEDLSISHTFRAGLVRDHGVGFASVALADQFSYHAKYPRRPTFGFHGQPNFWRHESDAGILHIHSHFPPRSMLSFNFVGLILSCLNHDRVPLAEALYALIRRIFTPEHIQTAIGLSIPPQILQPALNRLERAWH